jgi:hypothetical protein
LITGSAEPFVISPQEATSITLLFTYAAHKNITSRLFPSVILAKDDELERKLTHSTLMNPLPLKMEKISLLL